MQQRVRVFFKYAQLIRDHTDAIATLITKEQGKTLADARGDVFRGLEVVEHACSTTSLIMGETAENLSSFVDTYSYRQPLGVTAGICPFNFPAMVSYAGTARHMWGPRRQSDDNPHAPLCSYITHSRADSAVVRMQ